MPKQLGFSLEHFLPYKLVQTAEQVSNSLAHLYQEEFGISRPQWRVLATLGNCSGLRAKELAIQVGLDKVRISRTLSELEAKGYVSKEKDKADSRAAYLHLTEQGQALYQKVIPKAQAWEQKILAGLSAEQTELLFCALDTLRKQVNDN